MKFKIGDKVRVVNKISIYDKIGYEFDIAAVDDNADRAYDKHLFVYLFEQIELVSSNNQNTGASCEEPIFAQVPVPAPGAITLQTKCTCPLLGPQGLLAIGCQCGGV